MAKTCNKHKSLSSLKPAFSLYSANGNHIRTYGYEPRYVDFGFAQPFLWNFIVADVDRPIIGADFLYHYDLLVDLRKRHLLKGTATSDEGNVYATHVQQISMVNTTRTLTRFEEILKNFPSLIRPSPFLEKPKHDVSHFIETTGPPLYTKPRRLRREIMLRAKKEFYEQQNLGILRLSNSPWASPLLIRPKTNPNEIRICGDYRDLNTVTIPDRYPLPNMNDVASQLEGAKIFSVIDVIKAFHHIPVHPPHIPKTAITTHFGLWEYVRMPNGLRNAPATYQRFMQAIFGDLEYIFVYIDDILIYSRSSKEHEQHLKTVLERLCQNGLTINPSKCQLGTGTVRFLGHEITPNGIAVLPTKIQRMINMPAPATIAQLRRVIGSFNYYRDHIPHAADLLAPLNEMLKGHTKKRDKTPIGWIPETTAAFEKCRAALANTARLAFPKNNCSLKLTTDASDIAIGAVLEQILPDDTIEPLGFFSKKLDERQRKYPTYDRELLAIYEALQYFRHLVEGHPDFVIYTDHKPLTYAFEKPQKNKINRRYNSRRTTQLDEIAQITTNIKHISGSANVVADMLSRVEVVSAPVSEKEIATAQAECPEMNAWRTGEHDLPFSLTGKKLPNTELILWYNTTGKKPRIYVPASLRKAVFKQQHDLSHPGPNPTLRLLQDRYIWPSINKDVRNWAKTCIPCQRNKTSRHTRSALQQFPRTEKFDKVHVDIVGPLPETKDGKYLLTMIDRYSRWVEFVPIHDQTADTVARTFIREWISRYGVPNCVTTDRGTQFTSDLHAELLRLMGAEHITTTAYHPQANGIIERTHRRLKEALKCHGGNWSDALPIVLLGLRSTCRNDYPYSPAEVMFGKTLRLPGEFFEETPNTATPLHEYVQSLKTAFKKLQPAPFNHKTKQKIFVHPQLFDSKKVFVRVDRAKKPLESTYEGPYKVLKRSNKYFELEINEKKVTVSIDRLKPAFFIDESKENYATVEKCEKTNTPNSKELWDTLPAADALCNAESIIPTNEKMPQPVTTTRAGRSIIKPKRYLDALTHTPTRKSVRWAICLEKFYPISA